MKILHRDTLWLKISPKISLQNGVNMTSSLTKIIIIWNSICDQMDDVFLSAGQNSYYRHRPENELSRPEVNSRFLLGRGALALKASIFESWPRVWEAFFSLWRIEFSFFFQVSFSPTPPAFMQISPIEINNFVCWAFFNLW